MPIVSGVNLSHSYGERMILEGVSVSIEPGERIGIVGRNGEGKSTLLKILGGLILCETGEVQVRRGARVGYLHQDPDLPEGSTLREAARAAFAALDELQAELERVFERMGDAEGDELEKLLASQVTLEEEIDRRGGYAVDHLVDEALLGLDFMEHQFGVPVGKLSGGQRARLALARLLLERPDVVLLDEPTNHLDIAGREWLESFIAERFKGAVVLISHDRYLLDRCVDRIVEVERGRLIDYPGNYRAFREQRAERRLSQMRAHENQQRQFKKEEAFIRKFKAGQRAKQARGRESRLERARAETIERPIELDDLRLALPKAEASSEIVATARGLSKRYRAREPVAADGGAPEDKVLFDGLELKVSRGERWGVIGPNGAGKSTLVGCLLGEVEPTEGSVSLGARLAVGYFRQVPKEVRPDLTTYRYLQDVVKKEGETNGTGLTLTEQQARDLAGAFLFSGRDQEKEFGVLSGGERARLVLAGLLASSKNVMVLDEPTNHLDIPSAERLEEAIKTRASGGTFDGTVILISHDRALIDSTCEHLIVLDGRGGATVFHGNYAEWQRKQRADAERDAAWEEQKSRSRAAAQPTGNGAARPADTTEKKSSFSWMSVERIEERMGSLEERITKIDSSLGDPDIWVTRLEHANSLTTERDGLKAELDELEHEWLRKSGA
ncbi:MAG: ABC-F family ATP-binding cassette domain-containing protein [Planctomycetota bacterium]